MSTVLSPKDLATLWGSDPKTVRRFLRASTPDRAGKGGRWEIESTDVEVLTEAFKNRATTQRFKLADADEVVNAEDTDSYDSRHLDVADEIELDELDDVEDI